MVKQEYRIDESFDLLHRSAVGNYYGTVDVFKKEEKFYIGIDSYDITRGVEISKTLADLLMEELPEDQINYCGE
jgi:hypothetical protein